MTTCSYLAYAIGVQRIDGDIDVICAFPEDTAPILRLYILHAVQRKIPEAQFISYDFGIPDVLSIEEFSIEEKGE